MKNPAKAVNCNEEILETVSKDTRVMNICKIIDDYIKSVWPDKNVDEWNIGPSCRTEIKWQKILDDFVVFKVYEPVECEGCLSVKNRNNIKFKITIQHEEKFIQNHYFRDDITKLLDSATAIIKNKDKIISNYEKYIERTS